MSWIPKRIGRFFTPKSSSTNTLQIVANSYAGNPLLRGLVQLLIAPMPYGSAIDSALTSGVSRMRERRLRLFFDELAREGAILTEELIQSEDFLHAFFSTTNAALRTRRLEKVRLFAILLLNSTEMRNVGDDNFEEYLSILDDLSLRELQILLILKRMEASHPHIAVEGGMENDLQRASRFWEQFEFTVRNEAHVDPEHLQAILTRLNRTGLYETFTGMFMGYSGGKGKLTALFENFSRWIRLTSIQF